MYKVALQKFIEEELSNFVKNLIINTYNKGLKSKVQTDELILNKYSINFDFLQDKVILFDDVFTEDEPLILVIQDFISELEIHSL